MDKTKIQLLSRNTEQNNSLVGLRIEADIASLVSASYNRKSPFYSRIFTIQSNNRLALCA